MAIGHFSGTNWHPNDATETVSEHCMMTYRWPAGGRRAGRGPPG
jgi:hypothetical protein